jgi:hypothetical protein
MNLKGLSGYLASAALTPDTVQVRSKAANTRVAFFIASSFDGLPSFWQVVSARRGGFNAAGKAWVRSYSFVTFLSCCSASLSWQSPCAVSVFVGLLNTRW